MLFEKVFHADVERLRSMPDMWKSRKPPEPLKYDEVLDRASDASASKGELLRDGQKVWSLEESLVVFRDSLERLSQRYLKMKKEKADTDPEPVISFDKDDQDTLDFVAASANIRSTVFGIERKSRFDIKQMAGNIIPAIATTNAIVAGLCILQAFKVIKGEFGQAKEVCCRYPEPRRPSRSLTLPLGLPHTLRTCSPSCDGQVPCSQPKLPRLQHLSDECPRRYVEGNPERPGRGFRTPWIRIRREGVPREQRSWSPIRRRGDGESPQEAERTRYAFLSFGSCYTLHVANHL